MTASLLDGRPHTGQAAGPAPALSTGSCEHRIEGVVTSTTLHAVRSPVTLRGSGLLARDHAETLSLVGFQGSSPYLPKGKTKPPVTPASLAFPCERAGVCGGFVFGTLAVVRPVVNRRSRPTCPPYVDNHVDSMCTWLGRVVERPLATGGTPLVHLVETCSTGGMPIFSNALA